MIEAEAFKQGMRRLAAGVSIVTTHADGEPHGLVATSVSSVAAEPHPTLLVCVNRNARSHDAILRAGIFCVNILSQNDVDTAQLFSAPHLRDARFERAGWTRLATGAPALESALASFDCRVARAVEVHSHTIFIGEVQDLSLRAPDLDPLVYFDGRFASIPAVR